MRAALRPMPYRAGVLAIVRRGSCDCALRLLLEEGTKRTNGNAPPARTGGGACFGTGCIRSDGHMPRFMRLRAACHEPRFMRSCAVVHAPARRLTCGRAAAPAIVRRLPLRLCAAAIFRGRNETDKRKRAPRPYGRGARALGRGASGRVFGRTFRGGAADGEMVRGLRLTGLFSWRCGDGASGMTAGPSVFCGAVLAIARCGSCWRKERNGQTGNAPPARTGGGRVFWDGVHPVGCLAGLFAAARPAGRWVAARGQQEYFAAGTGAVWLPYGARFGGPRSACGMARPCG